MPDSPIVRPGANCWRLARADRAAVLVDCAAYFDVLATAIASARHQLLMLGWDFHSRLLLRRDGDSEPTLIERLDTALRQNSDLRVYILEWDWALLYAMERELWPTFRFEVGTHPRLAFALDDRHPFGASHHQKVVVVDDRLAFTGGVDLALSRWDTPEHRGRDPRRDEEGSPDDGPFHDVQIAVEGPAARALGDLARARWKRATGEKLPESPGGGAAWPEGLEADFRDVAVAVARTEPAMRRRPEVREVERAFLDSIAAARRSIYIENQYFTCHSVTDALARRLSGEDPPEVVLVLPRRESGWLEEATMGALRSGAVRQLREADCHDRLRVVHPVVPGLGERHYTLHAKVMVVDDRLLRVGSANLSNRSMGLDTECDVLVDAAVAESSEETSRAIAAVRDALLAEHLGSSPEAVQSAIRSHGGSLVAAVDELAGGERTLVRLEVDGPEWVEKVLPDERWLDPDHPIEEPFAARAPEDSGADGSRRSSHRSTAALVTLAVVAVGLAILWRWVLPDDWLEPANLARAVFRPSEPWVTPWVAPVVFAAISLAMVPVTALAAATGLAFDWPVAAPIAFAGSLLGAASGFALGRVLGRRSLSRLVGRYGSRVERYLARRGVLSVAALRLVPVAPFQVVNALAGATTVRARDYLLGSAIGLLPGCLMLPAVTDRSVALVVDPSWTSALALAGILLAWIAVGVAARRRATRSKATAERG